MDPEVIMQLEEQLRQLTEMLANQNSMMKSQMDAMNKVSSSASSAASSTRKNTETSTQATTKYAEAQEKATTQTAKSEVASKALAAGMGTLSASVSGLAGTFGALGSSLLSAEQGMAKYGKVADAAAGAAEGLAKSIPVVGGVLGGLVGVVGKVAAQILTDGLKLVDTFVNLRDGLVQVGGALPVTGEQLIKLANNAGYFGERMQVLGKITQGLGTSLATLDSTAGRGATKFMEIANVTDDLRRQYGRLGISQERLTEMQGMYIKSQEASGLSMQNQTKTAAQLRKESLAYVDNMTRLSALTGKQAEQLQAEQDLVAATIQERMEVVKENAQIKQLRAEGRHAEAAEIERQQKDRDLFRKQLTADLGPEAATMAMKVIRSGVYDNVSAPLANLGIDFVKYGQMIKEGGIDASQAARSLTTEYDKGVERIGTSLGAATEFLNDDQYKTLGVVGEAVGRGLTRAGKNYEEANAQAEKDIADRKKAGDDLADMVENVRAQERKFQEAYQNFLLDKMMKLSNLLKDFDLFGFLTQNFGKILAGLGAAVVAAAVASAALAAAAAIAAKKLLGVGGGGGPDVDAPGGTSGKGSKAGRAAKWGGRLARGVASGIGGLLGGMALDYGAEKALEAGHTKTSGALSVGSSAVTGAGIGGAIGSVVPILGTGVGAAVGGTIGGLYGLWQNKDKLFGGSNENAAQTAAAALGTAASPMVVDFAKPMPLDQATIDKMGMSEADMTRAMRTGQLDANTALIASIEDAKQQLQGSQSKTYEDAAKQAEQDASKRAEQSEQAQKYTIKQGDTLSELAVQFGTTVEALLAANPDIKNKDLIYAGASLNVPGQQYTVKQGDTMQNLAKQFGISEEELKKANPILQGMKKKDWKAGIKLNIPGKQMSQEEMKKHLEALYGPEQAAKMMESSGSQFMSPEQLAQLSLGGGLTTLPGLPGQAGNISTLPGLPGQAGNISTLPGALPIGGMGMFDSEQMEEMYNNLNATKRETSSLAEEQKSATDKLLGSTNTYDNTLTATNKSLALFRDLLDALNHILSPTAARSGQAPTMGGGSTTPTMPTDSSGPTDPSFGAAPGTAPSPGTPGSTTSTAPGSMPPVPSMPTFGGGGMQPGMPGLLGMPNGMMGMPMTGFDGNMSRILATIRQVETGGKYDTPGPKGMPGTASGAYAFIDSSWRALTKKYGIGTEYARAVMAPPGIQDQVAARYAQEILEKAGGDVSKIPIAWYTGNIHGKISAAAIALNKGNTPQMYQEKWMRVYSGQGGDTGSMSAMGGMPMMGMMPFGGGMMGGMQGDGGLLSNMAMMSNMMGMMGGGMMPYGGMMGGNMNPYFGGGMMGMPGMLGGGGAGQMAALQLARQYVGMSEGQNAQTIAQFLKAGGAPLNPQLEAWCAAFVNSALQQSGIRGTGSAVANSFQTWGVGVPINQPQPGDVVLETRGKPPGATGGHVGLATGQYGGGKIGMIAGNTNNKVADYMIPADGDVMVRRGQLAQMQQAERGGILRGPDSGYLAMLHGKEAVIPLDNKFTRSQSSESYTVNGKPATKKQYESFMKSHPELQNIQNKVQSMLGALSGKDMDPSKIIGSVSKLMDSNLTGIKDEIIDKNERIQETLQQVVDKETKKAIQAVTEANQPLQMISNEISTNMRKVMAAHNQTMNELTYKLGEMIDALNTSNDHTKKILKKAST